MGQTLIVGLGNPGQIYQNTPHNIGFMVLDSLANGGHQHPFDKPLSWAISKKLQAITAQGDNLLLLKPQTFMNKSGQSVTKAIAYFKIPLAALFIVHDDISIPFGQVKISKGKNAANHNGVQSIIDALHTNEFIRFRLGMGGPQDQPLETFVLSPFATNQALAIADLISQTCNAITTTLNRGIEYPVPTQNNA